MSVDGLLVATVGVQGHRGCRFVHPVASARNDDGHTRASSRGTNATAASGPVPPTMPPCNHARYVGPHDRPQLQHAAHQPRRLRRGRPRVPRPPAGRGRASTSRRSSRPTPERAQQVREDLPDAEIVPDLAALLTRGGVDLVVLASPSGVHVAQVHEVVAAGVPMVVDKPLGVTASSALEAVDAATRGGPR